jgi:hypothetical protein
MIETTELPVLQVHPTEALVPHEECDPRRVEILSQRILEEGLLKNPPVVSEIPDTDRFVVLDGANRTMAFLALKIQHIVAQVVSYNDPGVRIDTWYHVVAGLDIETFESALKEIAGLEVEACSLKEARSALETGEAIAYIVREHEIRVVCPSRVSEYHDLRILNDIVGAYKGRADIFRASNDEWEKQSPYYPGITAVVVFPPYKPQDILSAVKNGYKIPSGVTRHIIPFRAVNINIPLDILNAQDTLINKRKWLQDWMMERMAANAIRFYAEPTFSFNE